MTTAVITIVHDRADHLANLVHGLARCMPAADDFIVVDIASADPVDDQALRDPLGPDTKVQVVPLDRAGPLPLAAARNLGARRAASERLVFLDVDCIPAPDLVAAYASAPLDALACGPLRYLRRGWDDQPGIGVDLPHLVRHSDDHPVRPPPARQTTDARYELFWSLSFGIGSATWRRLGGFDEVFVGYGAEDTDLAFTARARRIPLVWLAAGTAFHQWHLSSDPPVEHLNDIVANACRFHDKWGCWPMGGWLQAFAERGMIRWDPGGTTIELAGPDMPALT